MSWTYNGEVFNSVINKYNDNIATLQRTKEITVEEQSAQQLQ